MSDQDDIQIVTRHIDRMGRRDFLRLSTYAAGLVAAGGLGLGARPALASSLPEGIAHMSADEYAVFHRLMQVLLPTDGSILVPPDTLPVLQTVDGGFLAGMAPHVLAAVKGGVAYFNQAPVASLGKPFTELTDGEATGFCDALAQSSEPPARGLFTALKFLVVTAYWAIPPAWEPTGFDGPVFERWKIDYAGNAPLPQA